MVDGMIDWAKTAELAEDVGMEGFDEVVELFLEEVDAALTALPVAPDIESALHFIKGCAMNLGFNRLANACAQGETLAAAGRAGEIDTTHLATIYAQSRHIFLTERHARLAA